MITQLSGHTLLVFAGIPALIIAVIALLVYAPSLASGPRYRPGLSWWAPPVWIGGPTVTAPTTAHQLAAGPSAPEADEHAVTTGRPANPAGTPAQTPASAGAGVARTTGGASASW